MYASTGTMVHARVVVCCTASACRGGMRCEPPAPVASLIEWRHPNAGCRAVCQVASSESYFAYSRAMTEGSGRWPPRLAISSASSSK